MQQNMLLKEDTSSASKQFDLQFRTISMWILYVNIVDPNIAIPATPTMMHLMTWNRATLPPTHTLIHSIYDEVEMYKSSGFGTYKKKEISKYDICANDVEKVKCDKIMCSSTCPPYVSLRVKWKRKIHRINKCEFRAYKNWCVNIAKRHEYEFFKSSTLTIQWWSVWIQLLNIILLSAAIDLYMWSEG